MALVGTGRPAAEDRPAAETVFDSSTVRTLAQQLAAKPYQAPDRKLPGDLSYDQYRAIRFNPDRAVWLGQNSPFQVQLFHRGFIYKERVDIAVVENGHARPLRYSPDLFSFGPEVKPPAAGDDLGFAGFKILSPFNRPDHFDEVCAFIGASYFRAVGKGQGYGLSARGLAIRTADSRGEEFPSFRGYWLERPAAGARSMVVHALLDSPSCTGAFRFTIVPGAETLFDTEAVVLPRTDIAQVGFAPLTSMYHFGPTYRVGVDDFRPAVHDSDALLLWNGRGEQIFRSLANPTELQISAFGDTGPRGFGLIQRKRAFREYEDLEAHYEKRPSLWVEPIGDWGAGAVTLVEIPTPAEVHDNIVAFWRPAEPLKAKQEYRCTYRLHWGEDAANPMPLARIAGARSGLGSDRKSRLFVIDVASPEGKPPSKERIEAAHAGVTASTGKIQNVVVQPNPVNQGWRVSFEFAPDGDKLSELVMQLSEGDKPLSERWAYRWTR